MATTKSNPAAEMAAEAAIMAFEAAFYGAGTVQFPYTIPASGRLSGVLLMLTYWARAKGVDIDECLTRAKGLADTGMPHRMIFPAAPGGR